MLSFYAGPTTPPLLLTMVWALSRSLAATSKISFDFSSCRYLDVSVPYVRSTPSTLLLDGLLLFPKAGLPHSETPGSKDA